MAAPTLPPPPLSSPLAQQGGTPAPAWARWLAQVQSILAGVLHPTTTTQAQQSGAIYQGSGVPSDTQGNNGDAYFRTDTPGTLNQRLYVKASGAWTGIL